jgi:ribosomal protein L37E
MTLDETFSLAKKVLTTIGLKNLKTKKSVEPSYLLVEYKESFMQKGEIEIYFVALQSKTEFSIDWTYPSKKKQSVQDQENHYQEIEEIRLKMNSTELFFSRNLVDSQFSKDESVKIKCRSCLEAYDEALGKCPKCGFSGTQSSWRQEF